MTERPDLRKVLEFYGADIHSERREVQILCPVHDENRPSCSVNLDKGVIHCMSCGFGGDAFDIIMKKEGFDEFRAALSWAEEKLGFSRGGVPQPARRGRTGVSREARSGFRPSYRKSAVRGRPLSAS